MIRKIFLLVLMKLTVLLILSGICEAHIIEHGEYALLTDGEPVTDIIENEELLCRRTVTYQNGLTIILYKIFNGDVLYFTQYQPQNGDDIEFYLEVNKPLTNINVKYLDYKEPGGIAGSYWESRSYKSPGHLPEKTLFINSMVLSKVDVFTPYVNGTLKENIALSNEICLIKPWDKWVFRITMPGSPGKTINHWGILSQYPLVDWQFEATNQQVRLADLNKERKFLPHGFMDKVATTYIPGEQDTFWWNPSQVVGEAFLRHDETKNRIFTDIAVVNLYQLISRQNPEGFWHSTPASTWLMKDYGIGANYYDTRFCSDAGMYLLQAFEKYNESKALEAAIRYGNYLAAHIQRGIKTKTGLLSPDYWSTPKPVQLPHTSLNHQLAEMNFLYRLYLNTGEERYKASAILLKNGVRDTGMRWVNHQGDLWYCVTSSGKYEKPDYQVLTLYDLIKANDYIEKSEGNKDPVITALKSKKYYYAKKKEYINW